MDADRLPGFLRWMAQLPRLFRFLETTGFNEAAVIIVGKGPQRFLDRGVGQEHGVAAWTIVLPLPLTDDHRMDGVGLEVAAIVMAPVLRGAILVIGGQPGDGHDLGLQPFGRRCSALPMPYR